MRSDRYTKVVLTVIAISLGALSMAQVGFTLSNVHASAPPYLAQAASQEAIYPPGGEGHAVRAGASSLPLRWRVRYARMLDNANTDCLTIITVRNLSTSATTVEVEWLDAAATSVAMSSLAIAPGTHEHFTTALSSGSTVNSTPFYYATWALVLNDFDGSAQVHANDPRISVAAFLKCDPSPSDAVLHTITDIPCDPIGTTTQYFQAGMPANWTPPMAVPEIPE